MLNIKISNFCFHKFFLRLTVSELLTILMIWGCTKDVHPLIIKVVNNSETVDRSKKNIIVEGVKCINALGNAYVTMHLIAPKMVRSNIQYFNTKITFLSLMSWEHEASKNFQK